MKKLALAGVMAAMGLMATASMAGIQGSKHDLTATTNNIYVTNSTDVRNEICVFCHTPHGSNNAFLGAPLWNKEAPTATYTLYGSTVAGTSTDANLNASSKACMSCHDGATAINAIMNMPGYNTGGTLGDDADGNAYYVGLTVYGSALTGAQPMPSGVIGNLGTDLRNDHPVSIVYNGADTNPANNPASLRYIDDPLPTTLGWNGGSIRDLLRGSGNDRVECVSCHDPHKGENPSFLRISNDGSALCLTCHVK